MMSESKCSEGNPTVNFDDTEIAYQTFSNDHLKFSYMMYLAMKNPTLVHLSTSALEMAIKLKLPVSKIVKETIYRQFCGGENLDDCKKIAEKLNQKNITTVFDYSVESTGKANDDAAIEDEIKKTIIAAKSQPFSFAVFKPTGLIFSEVLEKVSKNQELDASETEYWQKSRALIERLCQFAAENNVALIVDAEESWYQDAIDQVVEEMMARFNHEKAIVYQTVQMYRHDRLQYLQKLFTLSNENSYVPGIKLVRGAYMNKENTRAHSLGHESPIYGSKEETDQAYNEALSLVIENIDRAYLFAGTHNEYSTCYLTELIKSKVVEQYRDRIVFSQLYGMCDFLTFNLAHGGFHASKYLPYGPVDRCIPYLIRRAEENTSITGQIKKDLTLIKSEMERRKRQH